MIGDDEINEYREWCDTASPEEQVGISPEYVRERFEYQDGRLFYRNRVSSNCPAGSEAGYCSGNKRWLVRINEKNWLRYRLVWIHVHGEYPPNYIDHIDRNSLNDRVENLRVATSSQNNMNTSVRRNNCSGFKGVCQPSGTSLWQASYSGKYIGRFPTPEEAAQAYDEYVKALHGHFALTNKGMGLL